MKWLTKWLSLANLQHAYARLAPRERLFVAIGGATFVAFLLFLLVYECQSAKAGLRTRITAKRRQLEKVEALAASYVELKRQTDALTAKDPTRSPNSLHTMVDGLVAKNLSRDKVSSMTPSSKPVGDQYVEESVAVQLVGITLQQTVGVLYEFEQSATPLYVSRVQMKKRAADPYQFDVNMAVASIKTAG